MKFFLVLFLIFSFNCLKSNIIINEFMPAPDSGEPEWIEIYNPDDIPHDIPDLRICDLLNSTSCSVYVEPYSYLIITPKPNELTSLRDLPEGVPLIKASFPGLNNTFDAIVLKNQAGHIIDSAYYDMDNGEKGISFERINPELPPLNQNIGMSKSNTGATMGYRNSLAVLEYDAGISNISLKNKRIKVQVINFGEKNIETEIQFSTDDVIFHQEDIIIEDTLRYTTDILDFNGAKNITVSLESTKDQNKENDTLSRRINFPVESNTLVINEIMFDVDDNNAEYIEIFNNSNSVINLLEYSIHDESKLDSEGIIINNDLFIEAFSYITVAWDSVLYESYPYLNEMDNVFMSEKSITLNKTGDIIVLRSPDGSTVDSLEYDDDWHNSSLLNSQNISIEKIAPELNSTSMDSWASCVDERGGTPAIENSIKYDLNNEKRIDISPNPFSPYATNGINECLINYNYDVRDASITAIIYDRNGNKIKELKNNENSYGNGVIKWDGTNDKEFKLPPSQYILIFQLKDNNNDKIFTKKEVIVIGK